MAKTISRFLNNIVPELNKIPNKSPKNLQTTNSTLAYKYS